MLFSDFMRVIAIGVGATAIMDAWLFGLRRLGVPTLNFALVGRWVGHLARGTMVHAAIGKSAPVRGEAALGWATHYLTGIAFAALLVSFTGVAWMRVPTMAPAVWLGIATVVAPLFIMQPAMGAGFAASKTPTPARNCLKSLANHAVFGWGLYGAAYAVAWLA
ncbi:MAG: DUF2938 domain-containing protein [Rhodocyclaceae bacterium]